MANDEQGPSPLDCQGVAPSPLAGERGKDEFLSRFCRAAGAFTNKRSADLSSQVRGFARFFFLRVGVMSDN